jgi:2,4-dienoyl-CoA reductase-like NADH-dependent reductase (Old Yellow Enzyme family)
MLRTEQDLRTQAAMYEAMADFWGGPPTKSHFDLYSQWGLGGWGMIITGEFKPRLKLPPESSP